MATTTARTNKAPTQKRSHTADVNEQRVQESVEQREEQSRITTARRQADEAQSNQIIDASGQRTAFVPPEDAVVVVDDGLGVPVTDDSLFEAASLGDETALARLKSRLQKARHQAGHNQLEGGVQVVDDSTAIIRMSYTLEDFTYGPMTFPVLKQGQRYRLPKHVAKYLDGLGYVWH